MHRHLLICSLATMAAPALCRNMADEIAFGADVVLERQHQDFGDTSADLDTIAIQPHVFFSDWDFSLYLPWQHADGEYFVNGFQPQSTYLCQRFDSLTPTQLRLLQRRGRVDPDRLEAFCTSEGIGSSTRDSEESGEGDISATAHYNLALDAQGIWLLSAGVAYKWDNGDPEAGIGSGTREPSVDASIGFETDHWRGSVSGGYAFVSVSDSDEDLDNYAFASMDAAWKTLSWLNLGAACNIEQSYVPETDDIASAALYVELIPFNFLRFTIEGRDYLDTEGFPDREYTGRIRFMF